MTRSNHYSNSSALKLERSARAQVGRSNHYSNSSALKRHPCDIAAPALFQPLLKQQCSQTDLRPVAIVLEFQPLLKQQCSQTLSRGGYRTS